MKDNLIEKFILLALDIKKGIFLIDTLSLNYGIAGAILLELSELNKIEIKDKKLILSDKKLTGNKVLDASIKLINNSKRNRKVKFWINKIGNKANPLKRIILNDLYTAGVLKIDVSNYLWGLIKIYKYPILKSTQVTDFKENLKSIVLENKKPDLDSLLLLSLMNSCKLTRILFINKKEFKTANKKIKELTKNIEISDAVSQALKEIQAAVLVATTSAFVGASSAN